MKNYISVSLLIIGVVTCLPTQAESLFIPKFGYVDWGTSRATIEGADMEFERSESQWAPIGKYSVGMEYNYRFPTNFAIGAEASYERLEDKNTPLISGERDGYAHVYRYMAVAKYYIPTYIIFRPYVGFGLGRAEMHIHSTRNANLGGSTYMSKIGFELQASDRVGIGFEYRNAKLNMDDPSNNEFNSRNRELFFQITFHSKSRSQRWQRL